ncbi:methanethiol oxidase (plasmid) [Ruegeria pomeroyi DSS-3]|uniref:Methanethiol oxidase n=2 Tax=Ruegeria pomeroyi TaxID=89184 RepID=MTO_RUEPO|nr:methanethiol oxidase [Ruegeria pomeroyi]Q5LKW0.1 RecName: Full=Methanethiol oxidase; Short=MTO; Flags: Precursor [Ruegeria pomeroyi DSS-3]HCE71678.1 selenium-binding protein [Ruegeria sp.]AAV97403.1 methanethiol oxidase [Ruegeria pomeroyi DSS-3]NVK97020.1 methanethiol oxidase [Ruegeria pomeroyi]NVL02241.1 methanethiol oxidase [Ruegeria pomeroyi]
MKRREFGALAAGALAMGLPFRAFADETCQSPYMPKITGQEEFVYVWTLGVEGMGDEQDKLVTIDLRPGSATRGQVINSVSVGGRNEAHHGGFSADRRFFWTGGLDTNRIFIFDVHSDPSNPKLHKTIDTFVKDSGGVVGPHTFFALPGSMMITGLSNDDDHGGRTALVEYNDDGEYVATYWMPTADDMQGAVAVGDAVADGYGYDIRALIRKNVMLTSSFTGWSNYMMDFGQMLQDAEAMKRFGNTIVQWDLHTRQPKKVFNVPGAPLEIRFPWGSNANYAFSTTALTSQLWLIYEDDAGEWQAKAVADIGNPADIPLPVDISIAADDQTLWINSFMDGKTRLFDISDPHKPFQIYEKVIDRQVNMVSQSWDGKRVYFSSSLLANWDKKGKDDAQYLKAYNWDGKELVEDFAVDFYELGLGRAHIMRFGSSALYSS